MSETTIENGTDVLITTTHRGVFFGTLIDRQGTNVILKNARNCIYWPIANGGFLGLAKLGPVEDAKIGQTVDELELFDVTSISKCTAEATKRWREIKSVG